MPKSPRQSTTHKTSYRQLTHQQPQIQQHQTGFSREHSPTRSTKHELLGRTILRPGSRTGQIRGDSLSPCPVLYCSEVALAAFGSNSSIDNNSTQPPLLAASLNSQPAKFFLDSGSCVSIISRQTLAEFSMYPDISQSNLRILGISGSMCVVGKACLELFWDNISFMHAVEVGIWRC